ncbi:MAG: family 78 glycoside hydrolase catalytic domain, partial [Clostridia bacterium]|nr:family 78 glycoside hydrolase catalytic domain [Clostridia bacterium]
MLTAYDHPIHRSIPADDIRWRGFWITSMRFYHLPACRPYGHDRLPQFNSEIQNIHTLLRKTFSAKDVPVRAAKLYITGDDLYKVYLGGKFVGEGPAQSYPFAYNYNCYDVTDLVCGGENVLCVHLYYQGLFNIYLISADNLCGMIAQLQITYEDGSVQTVVSDSSWKYAECDAYTPAMLYGYQTQFSEDIDLARYPFGWTDTDFCDNGWENALLAANPYPQDYHLVPQITPTVSHTKVYPVSVKEIDGGYLLDFGAEVTGSPIFAVQGEAGHDMELRYGEELQADGRVRHKIRANCDYRDHITLSGGDDTVVYYDYKAYRYMEVLNPPASLDPHGIFTLCRHYPFPDVTAQFSCTNDDMMRIWDICRRGVMVGTQDTYYDCPTREKGGFVGDALITGLSHLILTGDTRVYKKFILDCANTARVCPAMMGHLPTYDINIDADYSALIPLFLETFYEYSGDVEFLADMLPVAEGIWAYYAQFLNGDGLLERIRHMPKVPQSVNILLVDWPQNLRDGYDNDTAFDSVCTPVNMLFYGFLKTLARLYRITGDDNRAEELQVQYTAMGEALIRTLYNAE